MLTISELEAATGVNRRNIHFYVQQGILRPPEGAGLGARYSDEHLLRLRAIPFLRNRGLRLDEIREKIGKASNRELEQILAGPQPAPGEAQIPSRSQIAGRAAIRYDVAPGVEIVADAALPSSIREKVNKLIEAAEALFNDPKGESR